MPPVIEPLPPAAALPDPPWSAGGGGGWAMMPFPISKNAVITSVLKIFVFILLSFYFYLLSFIFLLLSFNFLLLSFIFYLLSFNFYLLTSTLLHHHLRSPHAFFIHHAYHIHSFWQTDWLAVKPLGTEAAALQRASLEIDDIDLGLAAGI